jgi:lipopolysaccharide/colanic/teichoic acid biosynthesis glycosyltransferase
MAKRLFDLLAAGLGLIVLSPLLLGIAVWIRRDSPGPALFRQTRVGRGGRPFAIVKFRTMTADAATRGPAITVGADRRITAVGAFLRRTKLDELPQLINVLRGEMSLVGPRPEVPAYVALWPEDLRSLVLSVRPGMTDPASIRFADESAVLARYPDPQAAYRDVIMPEKLRMYAAYVRTAGFVGDLALILRTLGLLGRRA